MRRKNIDYDKLYREFFDSPYIELTPFLRAKKIIPEGQDLGYLGGNQRAKMKGWQELKKHELMLSKIEATNSVRKKNASQWKEAFQRAEEAEMKAINVFIEAVNKGFPIYSTDKDGHIIFDDNDDPIIVAYEAPTFRELVRILELLREIQGKDKNYVPLLEYEKGDPLRDRLREIRAMKRIQEEMKG